MDTPPGTPPKEVEVEVKESKETLTSAVQVKVSTAVEVETHFCKSSSKGSQLSQKGHGIEALPASTYGPLGSGSKK